MNYNESQQFELLDMITLISFFLQVMNLNENLTQTDKQDLMHEVDNRTNVLLNQIHQHLEK